MNIPHLVGNYKIFRKVEDLKLCSVLQHTEFCKYVTDPNNGTNMLQHKFSRELEQKATTTHYVYNSLRSIQSAKTVIALHVGVPPE
jgi:hypothetical protein